MRDDDPFNYPARCHERLLEIRSHLSWIHDFLKYASCFGWACVLAYGKLPWITATILSVVLVGLLWVLDSKHRL